MGHFVLRDVLYCGMFCTVGRFILRDVSYCGMFCLWDVLSVGCFICKMFCCGTFRCGTFCMCTILTEAK